MGEFIHNFDTIGIELKCIVFNTIIVLKQTIGTPFKNLVYKNYY